MTSQKRPTRPQQGIPSGSRTQRRANVNFSISFSLHRSFQSCMWLLCTESGIGIWHSLGNLPSSRATNFEQLIGLRFSCEPLRTVVHNVQCVLKIAILRSILSLSSTTGCEHCITGLNSWILNKLRVGIFKQLRADGVVPDYHWLPTSDGYSYGISQVEMLGRLYTRSKRCFLQPF